MFGRNYNIRLIIQLEIKRLLYLRTEEYYYSVSAEQHGYRSLLFMSRARRRKPPRQVMNRKVNLTVASPADQPASLREVGIGKQNARRIYFPVKIVYFQ